VIISTTTPATTPWELWFDPDAVDDGSTGTFPRTYAEEKALAASG
jgi:hypothetical protein